MTGIDFTKALYVRSRNKEIKVYVCHQQSSTPGDCNRPTFLLAFRHFVGCHSLPELMISDNALTYETAVDKLKELKKCTPLLDVKEQP